MCLIAGQGWYIHNIFSLQTSIQFLIFSLTASSSQPSISSLLLLFNFPYCDMLAGGIDCDDNLTFDRAVSIWYFTPDICYLICNNILCLIPHIWVLLLDLTARVEHLIFSKICLKFIGSFSIMWVHSYIQYCTAIKIPNLSSSKLGQAHAF